MHTPDTLPFSPEEFGGRVERVRRLMEGEGLGVMLVDAPENIYYLTGYRTTGFHSFMQTLVLGVARGPVLVTRNLEMSNAANARLEGYHGYRDEEDPMALVLEVLKGMRADLSRVGVEKGVWWLPVSEYEKLRRGLGEGAVSDCTGLVDRVRAVKSPQEIAYMRRAALAAEAGVQAGVQAIREGVSEADVARAVFDARIRAGSEFNRNPTYVVSGPRSALAHATWTDRRIGQGELVFLELGGTVKQYAAGLMRTCVVGTATDVMRRAADATIAGLEAGMAAMRPGVPAGEVDEACRGQIIRAGFGDGFKHRTGYS
jgi:Xaa-Pro dipeptidase